MKINGKNCFLIGLSAFLLFLAIHYWDAVAGILSGILAAAMPLLIGCAMAYLIHIPMSFFERHYFPKNKSKFIVKSRKPLCLVAAYLTFILIVVLLLSVVVPELLSGIQLLGSRVITALEDFDATKFADILPKSAMEALQTANWSSVLDKVGGVLSSGISGMALTAIDFVSSVFSSLVTTLLALIFSLYILGSKNTLQNQFSRVMKQYLPPIWQERTRYVLAVANDSFHRYIVGQCVEAVILGSLCTVGMLIFQMPYAGMIGTLIGFTALIPVAGAYIGAGVGAFLILTVSPIKALWFLVFIVVLQQLEGNLIYPRVVGNSIGLPGLWVLAAVTVGGGLFGVLGMLLGVPLAATLYRLLRDHIRKREEKAAVATAAPDTKASEKKDVHPIQNKKQL